MQNYAKIPVRIYTVLCQS